MSWALLIKKSLSREMQIKNLSPTENEKAADLARMKRLATGLLLLMTGIYVASHIFRAEYLWIELLYKHLVYLILKVLAWEIWNIE